MGKQLNANNFLSNYRSLLPIPFKTSVIHCHNVPGFLELISFAHTVFCLSLYMYITKMVV